MATEESNSNSSTGNYETVAVHCGSSFSGDTNNKAIVSPITTSAVFVLNEPKVPKPGEYFYGRWKNPNRDELEAAIAELEGAKYSCAYASGIAAIHAVFQMLRSGDHIVALDNSYSGTWTLLNHILPREGKTTTMIDFSDLQNLRNAILPETRAVLIETPTNPVCGLIDIRKVSEMLRSINPAILLIVDNTFATPCFQQPLALGADVVVHSCTKFINGHHDVLLGAAVTNRRDLYDDLFFIQKSVGAVPSPFDCSQCLRGIRTLAIRARCSADNTQKLAEYLEKRPLVEKVSYPGLQSHPQHELAKAQMINNGFAAMMAFYIRDADVEKTIKFVKSLKLIKSAVSLGGYDTTIQIPLTTSHSWVPKELLDRAGVTPNCLRISVGVENVEDLKADIDQALKAVSN